MRNFKKRGGGFAKFKKVADAKLTTNLSRVAYLNKNNSDRTPKISDLDPAWTKKTSKYKNLIISFFKNF